jgi:Na+/proline symporter
MTQVAYFRDRWEGAGIGTVIFALTALMMIRYIVIGIMGGGRTLEALSSGLVPYWAGGGIVAIVVMGYAFFGGIAFFLIAKNLGGFDKIVHEMMGDLGKR